MWVHHCCQIRDRRHSSQPARWVKPSAAPSAHLWQTDAQPSGRSPGCSMQQTISRALLVRYLILPTHVDRMWLSPGLLLVQGGAKRPGGLHLLVFTVFIVIPLFRSARMRVRTKVWGTVQILCCFALTCLDTINTAWCMDFWGGWNNHTTDSK